MALVLLGYLGTMAAVLTFCGMLLMSLVAPSLPSRAQHIQHLRPDIAVGRVARAETPAGRLTPSTASEPTSHEVGARQASSMDVMASKDAPAAERPVAGQADRAAVKPPSSALSHKRKAHARRRDDGGYPTVLGYGQEASYGALFDRFSRHF